MTGFHLDSWRLCLGCWAVSCLAALAGCGPRDGNTQANAGDTQAPRRTASSWHGRTEVTAAAAQLSPDGQYLFVAYGVRQGNPPVKDFKLRKLFKTKTGEVLWSSKDRYSIAFFPDGRRVLAQREGKGLEIRAVPGFEVIQSLHQRPGLLSLAVSSDGRRGLTGDDNGTLTLWDLEFRTEIDHWLTIRSKILEVQMSSDNRFAYCVFDGHVGTPLTGLFDLNTGKLTKTETAQGLSLFPKALSPDGRYAVSDHREPKLKTQDQLALWEAATGQIVRVFGGREQDESLGWLGGSAAFLSEGKQLLTLSNDGPLHSWSVSTGKLLSSVRLEPSLHLQPIAMTPHGEIIIGFTGEVACSGTASGGCLRDPSASLRYHVWTEQGKLLHTFEDNWPE